MRKTRFWSVVVLLALSIIVSNFAVSLVSSSHCTITLNDRDGDCLDNILDSCPNRHADNPTGCPIPPAPGETPLVVEPPQSVEHLRLQISHFEPESINVGATGILKIVGNNFTNETTVTIDGIGGINPGGRNVTFIDITMPTFTAAGVYTVTLTDPDPSRGSASASLVVTGSTNALPPEPIIPSDRAGCYVARAPHIFDRILVRPQPNPFDDAVGRIEYTESVQILYSVTNEFGNTWYRVETDEGLTGYVTADTDYVQIDGLNCPPPTTAVSEGESELIAALEAAGCPYENYDFIASMAVATRFIYASSASICTLVEQYLNTPASVGLPQDVSEPIAAVMRSLANSDCQARIPQFLAAAAVRTRLDPADNLTYLNNEGGNINCDSAFMSGQNQDNLPTDEAILLCATLRTYENLADNRYEEIREQFERFGLNMDDYVDEAGRVDCSGLWTTNRIGPATDGQVTALETLSQCLNSDGTLIEEPLFLLEALITLGWDLDNPNVTALNLCELVTQSPPSEMTVELPSELLALECTSPVILYNFLNFYNEMSDEEKARLLSAAPDDICTTIIPIYIATGILDVTVNPNPTDPEVEPTITPLPNTNTSLADNFSLPPTETSMPASGGEVNVDIIVPPATIDNVCEFLQSMNSQTCGFAEPLGAFVVRSSDNASSNIYILDYTEQGYRQLTDFTDGRMVSFPSISPDGQRIAYLVTHPDGTMQVGFHEIPATNEVWDSTQFESAIWALDSGYEIVPGSIAWYILNRQDDNGEWVIRDSNRILLTIRDKQNNETAIYGLYANQLVPDLIIPGSSNPVLHPDAYKYRTGFAASVERQGRILLVVGESPIPNSISHLGGQAIDWVDGYENAQCYSAGFSGQQTVFLCHINDEIIPFFINGATAPAVIELDMASISSLDLGPIENLLTFTAPAFQNADSTATHGVYATMLRQDFIGPVHILLAPNSARQLRWNLHLGR
jgi:hypothetical protein